MSRIDSPSWSVWLAIVALYGPAAAVGWWLARLTD
jgi:hypothetical protein